VKIFEEAKNALETSRHQVAAFRREPPREEVEGGLIPHTVIEVALTFDPSSARSEHEQCNIQRYLGLLPGLALNPIQQGHASNRQTAHC
jgi:hypothetical protein